MTRQGDWMQVYSGRDYWPLSPSVLEVNITDIAHALSQICRFGGHTDRYYSVAEHSVLVSYLCPEEYALLGLMHDATEAYVGDVIRPLKRDLVGYADIEARNWNVICAHFGLRPGPLPLAVKDADNEACALETRDLMKPSPFPENDWRVSYKTRDQLHVFGFAPIDAEKMFMNRYQELTQ